MSQARTPTKPKRAAAAPTSQTPTGQRGAKVARNADDVGGDKDEDDVRRDTSGELELEHETDNAGASGGAVAEHDADREIPVPEPLRPPSPVAASRARPAVFRSVGRIGLADSNSIRIAHVQLMTRGEPNANPSPSLYMSGYGLPDLFESFATTAKNNCVEKRMSLRTIWNGASCNDHVLCTLTTCVALGTFQY